MSLNILETVLSGDLRLFAHDSRLVLELSVSLSTDFLKLLQSSGLYPPDAADT